MNIESVMDSLSAAAVGDSPCSVPAIEQAGALSYMTTSVRYLLEAIAPVCDTCDLQMAYCDPTVCRPLRDRIRTLCQNESGILPDSSVRLQRQDSPVAVPTE